MLLADMGVAAPVTVKAKQLSGLYYYFVLKCQKNNQKQSISLTL